MRHPWTLRQLYRAPRQLVGVSLPCLRSSLLLPQFKMSLYVRLIRFHYHSTFAGVVFGALLTASQPADYSVLLPQILALYVTFNILLYGGIYSVNSIVDREADLNHPLKRFRPLPAAELDVRSAKIFAIIMIGAGLASASILFNVFVFGCFMAFVALNLVYSTALKNIPYLEIIANAATHPLRFVMGVVLVEGEIPAALVLAMFFLAFGAAVTRRCVERSLDGWRARPVLESYSARSLFSMRLAGFVAILLIATVDTSVPPVIYRCVLAFYCALVFGFELFPPIKYAFARLWTR